MSQVGNQDLGVVDVEEVYEVNEHVLVFYGKLLFDATILEIDYKDDDPYLVHFHGWNKRYDLWVPLTHMVKLTEDTRNQQMELQGVFKQEQNMKKTEKQKKAEARRNAVKEERKEKMKKNITNRASKAVAPQRPAKNVPTLIMALLEQILGATEKINTTARILESQAQECCHNFSSNKSGNISKANMKSILSVLKKTEKNNLDKVWSVLAGSSGNKSINASHFVDAFKQQRASEDKKNLKVDRASEDKKNLKVDTTQKKKQKKQARRRKRGEVEKEKEKEETKQERDRGRNPKRTRTQTRNNNKQTDVKPKKAHVVKKRKSRSGDFRRVVSWFTSHELKGIRAIAQEVSSLDLEAILEVEKADWQSMTNNLLAGSAISTFLKQFQ